MINDAEQAKAREAFDCFQKKRVSQTDGEEKFLQCRLVWAKLCGIHDEIRRRIVNWKHTEVMLTHSRTMHSYPT